MLLSSPYDSSKDKNLQNRPKLERLQTRAVNISVDHDTVSEITRMLLYKFLLPVPAPAPAERCHHVVI